MEATFFLLFLLLVSWLLCHIPRGEILVTLFMVYIPSADRVPYDEKCARSGL
jgi:hypothetical protein